MNFKLCYRSYQSVYVNQYEQTGLSSSSQYCPISCSKFRFICLSRWIPLGGKDNLTASVSVHFEHWPHFCLHRNTWLQRRVDVGNAWCLGHFCFCPSCKTNRYGWSRTMVAWAFDSYAKKLYFVQKRLPKIKAKETSEIYFLFLVLFFFHAAWAWITFRRGLDNRSNRSVMEAFNACAETVRGNA